jgi:hypothetical protein
MARPRGNVAASSAPASSTANGSSSSSSRRGSSRRQELLASFHPKLIATQIVALQCFHYFLLALLFEINHVFYSTSITIDRIFTDRYVRLWEMTGWPDVAAVVIASLAG